MELGVAESVPAFNETAEPHQFQQRFWRGTKDGEKEVPVERGIAHTLAAEIHFDDPAATEQGLGDEVSRVLRLEVPGGAPPVIHPLIRCRERDLAGIEELVADQTLRFLLVRSPLRGLLHLHQQEQVGPYLHVERANLAQDALKIHGGEQLT